MGPHPPPPPGFVPAPPPPPPPTGVYPPPPPYQPSGEPSKLHKKTLSTKMIVILQ